MARQSEAVHKQQGIVRGTTSHSGELGSEHMEAMNSRRGDKFKSAVNQHKLLGNQLETNSLQRKQTNAPDVAKHLGTTDNSVLQRMPTATSVKKLDNIVLAVILDKYQL